jgi:large subunit ribosomal protein L21
MYAIVDIAGQQFKVEKDNKIYVHRLEGEAGKEVEFDKVLLIDNDGDVKIGAPLLDGAKVTAQIIEHLKGDKVLVFKKRTKKGTEKLNGHRQYFTQVLIQDILEKGSSKKKAAAKEPKAEVSDEAVAAETSEAPQKAPRKSTKKESNE